MSACGMEIMMCLGIVLADGLSLSGAGPSAGTMMTSFVVWESYFDVLVINYGISNTIVLEMP